MDEWFDSEPNPELAQDIRRLQDRIDDALNFYYTLRNKYGELGGWEMVENKLTLAIGWAEDPLQPIPEEEYQQDVTNAQFEGKNLGCSCC